LFVVPAPPAQYGFYGPPPGPSRAHSRLPIFRQRAPFGNSQRGPVETDGASIRQLEITTFTAAPVVEAADSVAVRNPSNE